MKLFKYITYILLTVAVLSACEKNDSGQDNPPVTATNTVILFMPWAGNAGGNNTLYSDILNNVHTIERTIEANGTMGNTRLYACISSTPTEGKLIEITYNQKTKRCVRDTVDTYKWPTADPAAVMINRLSKIKQLSPTRNYSLIIGCHAMGWLPTQRNARMQSRYFGGTSDDYRMTSEDLATVLNYSDLHPQYILFDACYMANIETAYDLRKNCDYLIASTSELMDYGMPYNLMWNDLSSEKPDYNNICQQFLNFYTTYTYPYGTLSVIKTSEVEGMVNIMKEINTLYDCDKLIAEGTLRISDIQPLDGIRECVFFDYGSYIDNMCKDNVALRNAFTAQLQKIVPYKVNTKFIRSDLTSIGTTIEVKTFSGLTVSDPTQSRDYKARDMKYTTAWWKETH